MTCYRNGGCGPYAMLSCNECPGSKPEYVNRSARCEQITNYESLMHKTPEELAEFFMQISTSETDIYGDYDPHIWICDHPFRSADEIVEWLNQSVEEGDLDNVLHE